MGEGRCLLLAGDGESDLLALGEDQVQGLLLNLSGGQGAEDEGLLVNGDANGGATRFGLLVQSSLLVKMS